MRLPTIKQVMEEERQERSKNFIHFKFLESKVASSRSRDSTRAHLSVITGSRQKSRGQLTVNPFHSMNLKVGAESNQATPFSNRIENGCDE